MLMWILVNLFWVLYIIYVACYIIYVVYMTHLDRMWGYIQDDYFTVQDLLAIGVTQQWLISLPFPTMLRLLVRGKLIGVLWYVIYVIHIWLYGIVGWLFPWKYSILFQPMHLLQQFDIFVGYCAIFIHVVVQIYCHRISNIVSTILY